MNPETLAQFIEKLKEDPAMRQEFIAFAARHGIEFGELSDAELDDVAGGIGTWPTPERPAAKLWTQPRRVVSADDDRNRLR